MLIRCSVAQSGVIPYEVALKAQRALLAARRAGFIQDTLWLLEHPPTYTIGRRPGSRQHLLATEGQLAARGIDVIEADRGGDITFHGPGQRIGYVIFDLNDHYLDVHRYLRDLEEVLIRALSDFGLTARRIPGWTGVWVGEEKVAAIGVRMSYWVTMHGFSLNVDPDLDLYDGIVPCGIEDRRVTSLSRLLKRPAAMEEVDEAIVRQMASVFHVEVDRTTVDDLMRGMA